MFFTFVFSCNRESDLDNFDSTYLFESYNSSPEERLSQNSLSEIDGENTDYQLNTISDWWEVESSITEGLRYNHENPLTFTSPNIRSEIMKSQISNYELRDFTFFSVHKGFRLLETTGIEQFTQFQVQNNLISDEGKDHFLDVYSTVESEFQNPTATTSRHFGGFFDYLLENTLSSNLSYKDKFYTLSFLVLGKAKILFDIGNIDGFDLRECSGFWEKLGCGTLAVITVAAAIAATAVFVALVCALFPNACGENLEGEAIKAGFKIIGSIADVLWRAVYDWCCGDEVVDVGVIEFDPCSTCMAPTTVKCPDNYTFDSCNCRSEVCVGGENDPFIFEHEDGFKAYHDPIINADGTWECIDETSTSCEPDIPNETDVLCCFNIDVNALIAKGFEPFFYGSRGCFYVKGVCQ